MGLILGSLPTMPTIYINKYATFCADFEQWENEDLNAAETAYYLEVQARVAEKLLTVNQ